MSTATLPSEDTLIQADQLNKDHDSLTAYALLHNMLEENKCKEDSQKSDIYWRLARECYEIGLVEGSNAKKVYKQWMNTGMEYADMAIEMDSKNWGANKWRAIFLDVIGRMQGNRQRIINSFEVKKHLIAAADIDPSDAETQHCLGVWCYEISELSYIERKLAAIIYASPPETSYEEGLHFFLKAEELSPNFYAVNLMYLAKTYYQLKQYEECQRYCKRVLEFTGTDLDTTNAKTEAQNYLRYV